MYLCSSIENDSQYHYWIPRQRPYRRGVCLALLGITALSSACSGTDSDSETAPPLAGGATTVADRTSSAFENPAPNLSPSELEQHLAGDVAFEASFVTPPADVNPGLGPTYNNRACSNCHVRDGRGLPVVDDGSNTQLLVRVSLAAGTPDLSSGVVPVPQLGTQIQNHATFGFTPPATVLLDWSETAGRFPSDGEPYTLRRVTPEITLADGSPLPGDVMTSPRLPPPVFGLGLLEAVPETRLLELEDPDDADGDGISGRLNRVWDLKRQATVIGRFGWKASQPTLLQQAAAAYVNDMGVTNPLFPDADGTSELDVQTLEDAAFYTQTLAVPRRRDWDAPDVVAGEERFREIGCARCHVERLETGDHPVEAVRHQTIHPYTDLLLHNMGMDLADSRPDFEASGTEWRTPPLWGIGLTETVLGSAAYLHDGRARTLEEAILWHGGEAEQSRTAFYLSSSRDRALLLAFLRSL